MRSVRSWLDRPSISLRVDHLRTEEKNFDSLIRRVRFGEKPGIVYVVTRKNTELIMSTLHKTGIETIAG